MRSSNHVRNTFQELVNSTFSSAKDLEAWLYRWSDFEFALDDWHTEVYVDSFRDTKNQEKEAAYLTYLKEIEPLRKEFNSKLQKCFLKSRFKDSLSKERYAVLIKNFEAQQKIYQDINIPLLISDQESAHRYQKIAGELTVSFNSEVIPLPRAASLLSSANREAREELWRKTWDARLQVSAQIDQIFSKMVELRSKIASQAGCTDYVEYSFLNLKRFDYTRAECRKFHDSIEKYLVPIAKQIYQAQKESLKLADLRPWDVGAGRLFDIMVEPDAGKAPDSTKINLEVAGRALLNKISPGLVTLYDQMFENGEMDLDTRSGKGPGAFCHFYPKKKRPVIVMNAADTGQDLFVLLHEFGHAVHSMQSKDEPIHAYQNPGMEIAEVASMSMELFAYPYLDQILGKAKSAELRQSNLKRIVLFFPYLAQIDAFQLWLYENPAHSITDCYAKWVELENRFGGPFNWQGLEKYREIFWQQQHHLFSYPFYYIEYGIAQLGALQLMAEHERSGEKAVRRYLEGLSLGGSKPLPELYQAVGAKFDFSEKTVQPMSEVLAKMLELA